MNKSQDSAWVTARQGLEQLRGSDVDEIILGGEDGELLEGSQTNFYAVQNGVLWTAGDGVLAGTVRNLVLRT
jgi:branched-subunit amino acid aminotransferase/4-amino-4-deoxychorismate lyase